MGVLRVKRSQDLRAYHVAITPVKRMGQSQTTAGSS